MRMAAEGSSRIILLPVPHHHLPSIHFLLVKGARLQRWLLGDKVTPLKTWKMKHLLWARTWVKLKDSDSDFSSFLPGSWAQQQPSPPPASRIFLDSIHLPSFPLLLPWFWSSLFHDSDHNSFLSALLISILFFFF